MEEKKYRISTEESLLSKLFLTYLGLMDEEGNINKSPVVINTREKLSLVYEVCEFYELASYDLPKSSTTLPFLEYEQISRVGNYLIKFTRKCNYNSTIQVLEITGKVVHDLWNIKEHDEHNN